MRTFILIFTHLILFAFSVLPNWKLNKSSIDLLNSVNSYEYQIYSKDMYSLNAKLTKKITKSIENDEIAITHSNKLTINTDAYENVTFENIESQYQLDNLKVLCPRGSSNPLNLNDNMNPITFSENWLQSANWDLKCYYHRTNYFLVFYNINGKNQVQVAKVCSDCNVEWTTPESLQIYDEIYDFKLVNKGTSGSDYNNGPFPFMAIIKENNDIKLFAAKINFETDSITIDSNSNSTKILTTSKNFTKGFFNKDNHNFYYITYNNITDFLSGFSSETITGSNNFHEITSQSSVINNDYNPFEYLDEVEIQEINFLPYNKYVYYSLYNKVTMKTYHGILDITLNKIMYNTDDKINLFIPYSKNSMLAITDESAYRICAIQSGTSDCIEECSSGQKIILDTESGNKCVSATESCPAGSIYTLIPEGICISTCDSSIFISNSTNFCGLCRDMDNTKPYKILDSTKCLSESEIPVGAEIYNAKLKLLRCKSGYILSDDTCVPHCYETCLTCTEYSTNENSQHCLDCIEGYELESGENSNCNKIIPTTIITTIPTTIITTIPTTIITTIPTTIITTIPTTIITTIPTTIITTIPTTIITTIPTTIITTIPTTIITTIPTTIITTLPNIDCNEENSKKCLECDLVSNQLGLCLSCLEGFQKVNYTILHPEYVDCLKRDNPILRSFYYDSSVEEYKPCYKTCKKCLIGGDAESNNCLECIPGYMFRPGNNERNNCVAYSEFYYISPYGQYKTLNILQCPEESKYIIKEKKSCIDDCKKDEIYKFLYNGNCVKECPSNTQLENYICKVELDRCTLGENNLNLENNDLKVIDTLVKTYLSEFNYTNIHVSLYHNDNYTIVIYKESSCIKELSLQVPYINFQQCYIKVQRAYNITEDLIISLADRKLASNAKTYYSFYHPISGAKLDADNICKDDNIIVEENLEALLDKNSSVYNFQTSLTSQGINIFDLDDPFYTDICYDFENPIKRDIPLNDRIKDLYPEASLCDKDCKYKGIDLNEMIAECDCTFNDITNNALIKDNEILNSMVGEIFDLINSSNIQILKCFKYIFKHFTTSVGGWVSLVSILVHIAMVIFYFLKEFNYMKNRILNLTKDYLDYISNTHNNKKLKKKNNPPKKNIKNKKSDNNIVISNLEKDFDIKSNNIKTNKKMLNNNEDDIKIVQYGSSKELPHFTQFNIKRKEETQNYLNSAEKNPPNFFDNYLSTSPDEMEYDDALFYDQRTFKEKFIERLHEKQMFAHTFIAIDIFKPRTIKIILFVLNIILYFVVNGFFFSETVISELYKLDDNEENFFSYFPRSIERIIYSTLVSIIIGIITDFFFVEEKKIKGIYIREKEDIKILKEKINKLINNIKIRNIAFIITVSVILLFSFFYLLCFNYVYPYTQIEWIKSSVTIVIIMQLLSFLKCLLESGFRALSFKIKSEKIYKISKLLEEF